MGKSNRQDFEKQKTGDIAYDYYSDSWDVLHIGTSGQFLWVASGLPAWHTLALADVGSVFATPSVVLGAAAAAGAAGTTIRSDATIAAFDATAPTTIAVSDAAAVGSIAFAARRDHRHGSPASWTPSSHDHTVHTDRTRRIPLVPVVLLGGGAATPSLDIHGSLNGFPHLHFADGVDSGVYYAEVPVPADDAALAASDWVLHALWSSSVGGNNIFVEPTIVTFTLAGGDTAGSVPLDTPAAVAADAAANKQKHTTWAFSSLPGAKSLSVLLLFTRTNVGDTNTGQVSLYNTWIEYLADM